MTISERLADIGKSADGLAELVMKPEADEKALLAAICTFTGTQARTQSHILAVLGEILEELRASSDNGNTAGLHPADGGSIPPLSTKRGIDTHEIV